MYEDIFNQIRDVRPESLPKQEPKYECSKCKDSGWLEYTDEKGYLYSKRCDCWAVRESRRMIQNSGISEEFRRMRFSSFDTRNSEILTRAKKTAMKYVQSFPEQEHSRNNSILFCGQVGAGKTHLGISICNSLLATGVAITYMPYRNAVTKMKQNITDEQGYSRELERYSKARVLYIDDLLKGRVTESDTNILYELINHRYMNSLPLVISTELMTEQLLAFDEAIGSRIIEMCRGNIIQLLGKELNYRLR
ncbi:MAG: ATP-binding protein [Lachnospiraceae bacterium]|nr:ATP-binding protein [Lachnospiraceae bacterium]